MLYSTGTTTHTAAQSENLEYGPARWAGKAMIAGGALWIVHFLLFMGAGFAGGLTMGTPLAILDGTVFSAAILGLSVGLLGLGLRLRPRSAFVATAGMAVAVIAGLAPVFGLVTRVLQGATIGAPGGIGVLGSCLGATLIGIAALRGRALPRRLAALLLVIGILTFPLIIAISIPFAGVLPTYVTDEFPFAASGAAWMLLGVWLTRD